MKQLPKKFLSRMETMLDNEFPAFLQSYDFPRKFGLRVNTNKISVQKFLEISPFRLEPIPWIDNGFFYDENDRPSRHPYYFAGLYYLQEPSAMTPANRFSVNPGEYVLDLCAAPGGKATELGAKLQGKGFLVANDISNSRAKALLRNLELFGIKNSMVTNETPAKLAKYFPEFFDKILVDAPCSGEGMFRKDPDVAKTWDETRPEFFSKLQKEIVTQAISMLKPGGELLYSTCTFSPEENEGMISFILENFSEIELLNLSDYEGFTKGNPAWGNNDSRLEKCVRIFPHHMDGEGHFLALMKKNGCSLSNRTSSSAKPDKTSKKLLEEFFKDMSKPFDFNRIDIRNENVYYLPDADTSSLKGIKFLRNGLFLGELKKNRFEPSQPFAMSLQREDFHNIVNLSSSDERVMRYLKGETLILSENKASQKGWHLVCTDGFPLGWGKVVGTTLKNKYPAGWRLHY